MTLFLRTKKNKTLVDIEVYVKHDYETEKEYVELHSVVDITNYSKFLLEHEDIADDVIAVFNDLSELRGWLWENYFMVEDNDPKELPNVIKEVRQMLNEVATKYDLMVVTD